MYRKETTRHHVTALVTMVTIAWMASSAVANNMTDANIADAIEDEYIFDSAVPFNDIDVSCIDGVVTLNGQVNNLTAKHRAADIAMTVKGVRSVVNDVAVKPSKAKSPTELKNDINRAFLLDAATESYEIDVTVDSQSVVQLRGNVDSYKERELAEVVAGSVSGVAAIENFIIVEHEDRSDIEIKNDIEKSLRWNTLVDDELIDVNVKDGKVSLSGTVGSAAEKAIASRAAWVMGAQKVSDDGLTVAKWARDEDMRKTKYVSKPDDQVEAAIKDALMFDARVYSSNVTPKVDRGVATLRGTVSNLKAKRAAETDTMNTVGVKDVINRIKVRSDDSPSDSELAQNVQTAMALNPTVNAYGIAVGVRDGVVNLTGDVDSYYDKAVADDVASRTEGVKRVKNKLDVDYGHYATTYDPYVDDWYVYGYDWYTYPVIQPLKTDKQILEDIRDELWWSPFVDSDDVTITVENGVATLNGTVDSFSEFSAASENAREGGAVGVINNISITSYAS